MSEPRINVYICQKCGKHTVTVDVDEGVTPFMIGCRAQEELGKDNLKEYYEALKRDRNITIKKRAENKGCKGMAYSSFYPRGPKPAHIGEPTWEWYKPTDAELVANYDGDTLEGMREHVAKGGLDLRRRTNKAPVMHPTETTT